MQQFSSLTDEIGRSGSGVSAPRASQPRNEQQSNYASLRPRSETSLERPQSDGTGEPACRMEVIDLRQELEECQEDKESVASETVPQGEAASLIEADMQTTLNENKQALSEGGYSDHESKHSGNDEVKGVEALNQDSGEERCVCQQLEAVKKIRQIEVLKILGEGSQGVVALCRHKSENEYTRENTAQLENSRAARPSSGGEPTSPSSVKQYDDAFVMKVFSHWLHTEEEHEVREVRLGNIQNENEVMDLLLEAKAFEKASMEREEQIEEAFKQRGSVKEDFSAAMAHRDTLLDAYHQKQQSAMRRANNSSLMQQMRMLRQPFQRTEPVSQFLVQKGFAVKSETHTAISMDYCAGGELYMLLRAKKRFQVPEAQFYAATILQGLEALHMANVVYRDLKPENVLIDEDGYTKLCDFGLSIKPPEHLQAGATSIADDASSSSSVSSSSVVTKKSGSSMATTTFFGTLEYSPPEFFLKQEYSGQSDLWAFGCLLYEFIVGVPPFFDFKGNRRNTIRRILQNQPDLRLIRIPGNRTNEMFLCDLISRLLAKDVSQRPQSVREVKQHSWFANIDWDQLCHKKYKAPFIPRDVMQMHFFKEHNRWPDPEEDSFVYDTRFFSPKQTKKDTEALQEVLDNLISRGSLIPSKLQREIPLQTQFDQAMSGVVREKQTKVGGGGIPYSGLSPSVLKQTSANSSTSNNKSKHMCHLTSQSSHESQRKWSGDYQLHSTLMTKQSTMSSKMTAATENQLESITENNRNNPKKARSGHTAADELEQSQLTRASTLRNAPSNKSVALLSDTTEPS